MTVSDLSVGTNFLTVSVCSPNYSAGLALPKSPSAVGSANMTTSNGFSISRPDSISGRVSTSTIAAVLRPPRTCDLRTMVEVVLYDLRRQNTSLRASERAHGPQVRKPTR